MEMTFRWYGSQFDTVTLKQIRQIARSYRGNYNIIRYAARRSMEQRSGFVR